MSALLILDMGKEAKRCRGLASGYGMAGETKVKALALRAAQLIELAADALNDFESATGEQISLSEEA